MTVQRHTNPRLIRAFHPASGNASNRVFVGGQSRWLGHPDVCALLHKALYHLSRPVIVLDIGRGPLHHSVERWASGRGVTIERTGGTSETEGVTHAIVIDDGTLGAADARGRAQRLKAQETIIIAPKEPPPKIGSTRWLNDMAKKGRFR